jgi:REP element-mobilizing transposase RayT
MPRTARASVGGLCYHVRNRGNARRQVFFKDGDDQAFLTALGQACAEVAMRVLGYCLLPNHFHSVVWPRGDGDLSRWLPWLRNAHVRRYHRHYHSSGPLTECELAQVRESVQRGRPFGPLPWKKVASHEGPAASAREHR